MITFILQGSSPPHPQKKEISPKCCAPKSHKNPGVGKHILENSPKKESFFWRAPLNATWHTAQLIQTNSRGKRSAPPRKKEALPCPIPWKLPKPVGAVGQSWFQSIEIRMLLRGRIQFIPINICLAHKSVDVRVYTSTEWTGGRQDHRLYLYLITIPTNQRHIGTL